MQIENYVGYECDACGHTWEQSFRDFSLFVQCPECDTPQHGGPDVQVVVGDVDVENGMYECYACGHTFAYTASRQEYPDEKPNCTHCGSTDTALIY